MAKEKKEFRHSAETRALQSEIRKAWWRERKAHPVEKPAGYIDLGQLAKKKGRVWTNKQRRQASKRRKEWWRKKRRNDRKAFEWESGVKDDHRGRTNRERMAYPIAGWKMMACRMAPGRAYTRSEINGLVGGSPINSVRAWLAQWLLAGGYVEKIPHPDYRVGKCKGRFGRPGVENPRFVYRLTEGGVVAREGWLGELFKAGGECVEARE